MPFLRRIKRPIPEGFQSSPFYRLKEIGYSRFSPSKRVLSPFPSLKEKMMGAALFSPHNNFLLSDGRDIFFCGEDESPNNGEV